MLGMSETVLLVVGWRLVARFSRCQEQGRAAVQHRQGQLVGLFAGNEWKDAVAGWLIVDWLVI